MASAAHVLEAVAVEEPRREPRLRLPSLTRAETAPCTCPEPCERDHDRD